MAAVVEEPERTPEMVLGCLRRAHLEAKRLVNSLSSTIGYETEELDLEDITDSLERVHKIASQLEMMKSGYEELKEITGATSAK